MIIAITAPKGSGKDLTADYIVEKYKYEKIAYADHLKKIIKLIFNFSDKELFGSQQDKEQINEEWGISSRQAALAVGDFMRYTLPEKYPEYKEKIGSDYFVDYVIKKIQKEPEQNYIISDVRFNNEIDKVRKNLPDQKILLIRLIRKTEGFNDVTDKHHSENTENIDSEQIDTIIENNDTIESLYSKIDNVLIKLQ